MNVDEARVWLAILEEAGHWVTIGRTGYGGTVTQEARAHAELSEHVDLLAQLRPELEAMTVFGHAGARIYAALLLKIVDPARAARRLEALLDCAEPCNLFPGGCCGHGRTVGEVAGDLLCEQDGVAAHLVHEIAWQAVRFDSARPRLGLGLLLRHPGLRWQRAAIERLSQRGRPTARLNAALLLMHLDPELGKARLLALATDPTPIHDPSGGPQPTLLEVLDPNRIPGGAPRHTTVAWCARQVLSLDGEDLRSLPPVPPDPPPLTIWQRLFAWWRRT